MTTTRAFTTDAGSLVLLEPSYDLPMVDVSITLRSGSTHDPKDMEGLTRLSARLLRMGTRALSPAQVDDAVDGMGAQLAIECSPSSLRIGGVVLARNLDAFMGLLGELLCKPALRKDDLGHLKRESLADLNELLDNDRALAARHFRRFCLPGHPYGRSVMGNADTLARIQRSHVADQLGTHLVSENLIIGFAGPVDEARARQLIAANLSGLPRGRVREPKIPEPRWPKGRRMRIVDKPERTQTQILIGALGARATDDDLLPWTLANTVFGGTFTSRLTKQVRSKRGWSYGASSSLGYDRGRDLWSMWTFPSAKDAVDCAALQLRLMDEWVKEGVSARELRFAQQFTKKSHTFEVDTAGKRLEHAIEAALMGLPIDHHARTVERAAEVTLTQANDAVRAHLSADNVAIVMVASADDVRERAQAELALDSLDVIDFSTP